MTATVYLERLDDRTPKLVQSIGQQPGPGGGDSWQQLSMLPTANLTAGHRYAFLVRGKLGGVQRFGTLPAAGSVNGVLQVCLGDTSGLRHPEFVVELSVQEVIDADEGEPFAFLLMLTAATADPLWGSSWAGTSDLALFGRVFWNGDAPTYGATFLVSEVVWTWTDLDAVAGTDWATTQSTTPVALSAPTSWQNVAQAAATTGSAGQQWLHFATVQVDYSAGTGAPRFQFGYCTGGSFAGFAARVGVAGPAHMVGVSVSEQHQAPAANRRRRKTVLAWWVDTNPGATYLPAVRSISGNGAQTCRRFSVFSLRLDDLDLVAYAESSNELGLIDYVTNSAGPKYVPQEVAAPNGTVKPWVLLGATSRVSKTVLYMDSSPKGLLGSESVGTHVAAGDRHQCIADTTHESGPPLAAVQYRHRVLQLLGPGALDLDELKALVVFPVKDPTNTTTGPGTPGAATAIVPGKEGLDASSLSAPPLQPNVQQVESNVDARQRLKGDSGYVRTWGVMIGTRRVFRLEWSPVSRANRDALLAFLRANVALRVTPLHESAIAAAITTQPTATQVSAQTFAVEVEVAELIYTGP